MNRNIVIAIELAALLSGTLGCTEDAVIDDKPQGVVAGAMAGAGGSAGVSGVTGGESASAGTGGTGGAGGTSALGGMSGGLGGASGVTGGSGGEVAGTGGGMGGEGGEIADAGGGMGGEGGAMGGVGGVGGGDEEPGPCPAGWTCEDTSVLGATDKDGNPITGTSCGKGGLIECDDANPAASCPELTHPICAHVFGVTSCTQLCTP